MGPISFNFMQFLGKMFKLTGLRLTFRAGAHASLGNSGSATALHQFVRLLKVPLYNCVCTLLIINLKIIVGLKCVSVCTSIYCPFGSVLRERGSVLGQDISLVTSSPTYYPLGINF